ncbi:hypothetical protein PVL29_015458 [Vitis rotundifolia]|nr:hypothetical protein PVL29_015458 [Vitis rotundifolia]
MAMRFKRVSAAFDDVARARLCDSSGSDHSEEDNSAELSDLVDLFLERDVIELQVGDEDWKTEEERSDFDSENCWSDSVTRQMLQSLIGGDDGNGDDDVKRKIRDELEVKCRSLENCQAEGFKRRLMTLLRRRGFDAGLCKSRWEKTSRCPGGEYEYIDVVVAESRYVVEVFLAGEFTIARPTSSYQSLLQLFPRVMVVKQFELKQMVRLMCAEMKKSMKIRDMPVPPWRKNGYMQAKWFGPYKRTVNAIPTGESSNSSEGLAGKGLIGLPAAYNCSGEFVRKVGFRSGRMGQVLNGMEL